MPDELIGQGDVVRGYYTRQERMVQIQRYLDDGKIRSTSEIARALKMRGSTNLRKMLLDLWETKTVLAYKDTAGYRWQIAKPVQLKLFPEGQV